MLKLNQTLIKNCKKYTIKKNGNKIKFKCDNTSRLKFGECGCNKKSYFGLKSKKIKKINNKINKNKIYRLCRRYGVNSYKLRKVRGRKVRKNINVLIKACLKRAKSRLKKSKSKFGKIRKIRKTRFGYTLDDLKNLLRKSGNEDSDRTLNQLYRLCVDEGVYSQYVPIIHSFLREYGTMKARDIMLIS